MLRGKMPHFQLTSVVQKRLCLSSLFSVVQATEALSFLFSFRGWRKDGRLVIFNLISLLRIGNDGLQWRGYVLGEAGEGGFVCCLTLNFKPLRLAYWGWSKGEPCPFHRRYFNTVFVVFFVTVEVSVHLTIVSRHYWSSQSRRFKALSVAGICHNGVLPLGIPIWKDGDTCRKLELNTQRKPVRAWLMMAQFRYWFIAR